MSIYASDGSLNVAVVDGSTITGVYAASGTAINVILAPGNSWVGAYHPCGAWYVTLSPGTLVSARAPDGSLYVQVSPYTGDSGQNVTVVSGSLVSCIAIPAFVPLASNVPANVHCDFLNSNYWILGDGVYSNPAQFVSIHRASFGATDLLPTSAAGASYSTFGSDILRVTSGKGVLVEVARTNQLLNSVTPATQTTASLATGSYIAWMNGSGSMAVSAGTATITGAGTATNGSPNAFTVTVAGTVTVTMSGQVLACQLEAATQGTTGTSLIVTGGVPVTRLVDAITLIGTPLALMGMTDVSLFVKDGGGASGGGGQRLSGNVDTVWLGANAGNSMRSVTTGFSLSAVIGGGGSIALPCRSGLAWNASGRSLVINNGTLVTDAHDVAVNTTWSLGQAAATGTALNGYVQSFDLWSSRVADTDLKGLTV